MADGTLQLNLQTLESALSGVAGLLGEPGSNGEAGSGLAGAAAIASESPVQRVQGFESILRGQMDGIFQLDVETSITSVTGAFATLTGEIEASPTAALDSFVQRLSEAQTGFGGEFLQRLPQTIETIRGITEGVPPDPTAIASTLLDQILGILGSIEGPEAAQIRSWAQSLAEMRDVLLPLIAEAENSPDPAEIVVAVIRRALESVLEVFGFEGVQKMLTVLDGLLDGVVPSERMAGADAAIAAVRAAYADVQGLAEGTYADFRDAAVSAAGTLQDLKNELRPILGAIRRVTRAPVFQPGALERYLREQLELALSVQVTESQRIDDPFNALFDCLDAAIDSIDLSAVRTEVLGFFENLRTTIDEVDLTNVTEPIREQLQVVQGLVDELQTGVAGLLAQVQAFFDDLNARFRQVAENVGQFQPDGSFRFHLEKDLRGVLDSATLAIAGDPANPGAPSVAGSLADFQTAIDGFLAQLNGLLGTVEGEIANVTSTAVGAIEDFTAFLEGLDVPALVQQLQDQVRSILDALVPIDFSALVDPVVNELNANAEKLRGIDPSSLNDLLREALATALEVIVAIDFTNEIAKPLEDAFVEIRKAPAEAIEQLQARYADAVAMLDRLSPSQLLEALFAAFDTVNQAMSQLNVATLLAPLDELHSEYLVEPLSRLKPSTLLEPIANAQRELLGAFDQLQGSAVLAPLNAQLDSFKGALQGLDLTGFIDEITAAIEEVKSRLRDIRPSEFLEPLSEEFTRLESELDRFSPSVLFAPATELATPLLGFLENIQEETIDTLFQAFQAPIAVLDRLEPNRLTAELRQGIDQILAAARSLQLPVRFTQLKGNYFDLKNAVAAGGEPARVALIEFLDPQRQLGEFVETYEALLGALEGLKQNLALPDLEPLYNEMLERALSMLPPYARALLDPEEFKRVMRLADPTRFVEELDVRFQTLKNKLIPIRPQDIAAELDETYDTILALVDEVDVTENLQQVASMLEQVRDVATGIRVDFLAADIDEALADIRSIAEALDIRRLFGELDELHRAVEEVVAQTRPSIVLAGLQTTFEAATSLVAAVDPRETLVPPLDEAWEAVEGVLGEVDFRIILQPVLDKLDELKVALEDALRETETAFDGMLSAAANAMRGSGSGASAGVSL